MDRGLILEKLRDSLARLLGRKGICRSDPLDPDLAAQTKWVRDLISTVGAGSDGWNRLGARGSGGARRGPLSRGGTRRGSPEFTVNGAPGAISARAQVREIPRGTGNPPRLLAALGEALGGMGMVGGGSARRSSPAQAV